MSCWSCRCYQLACTDLCAFGDDDDVCSNNVVETIDGLSDDEFITIQVENPVMVNISIVKKLYNITSLWE